MIPRASGGSWSRRTSPRRRKQCAHRRDPHFFFLNVKNQHRKVKAVMKLQNKEEKVVLSPIADKTRHLNNPARIIRRLAAHAGSFFPHPATSNRHNKLMMRDAASCSPLILLFLLSSEESAHILFGKRKKNAMFTGETPAKWPLISDCGIFGFNQIGSSKGGRGGAGGGKKHILPSLIKAGYNEAA